MTVLDRYFFVNRSDGIKVSPDASVDVKALSEHINRFPERWKAAFDFLNGTDLSSLTEGRYEISGCEVNSSVQVYRPMISEDSLYECHRRFIDLQYLIKGKERVLLLRNSELDPSVPYDAEKDIAFYKSRECGEAIHLSQYNYCLFFPSDYHSPCHREQGEDDIVKKLVIKIEY